MSLELLFLHPKNREYFNKVSASTLRLVLFITTVVLFFTSGLAGMYVTAIAKANLTVDPNITYFFSSALIQITFLVALILLQRFIYTNNKIKTNLRVSDIIIIEQLIITKDLLYLLFLFIQMQKYFPYDSNFATSYYWKTDAKNMDLFLYVALLILIMFYLIPKIIPLFDVTRRDFNRGMVYSLLVSIAIVLCVVIITIMVQTIVNIPLGA